MRAMVDRQYKEATHKTHAASVACRYVAVPMGLCDIQLCCVLSLKFKGKSLLLVGTGVTHSHGSFASGKLTI